MNNSLNTIKNQLIIFLFFMIFPSLCFADGGGIDKLNTLTGNIKEAITVIGIPVATIAFCWCGYKFFFKGAGINDIALPLIGGVIAGSAAGISNLLLS